LVKQFFSVIDGRIGQCGAAQHVGDFLHASFFVQLDDMAAGTLRVVSSAWKWWKLCIRLVLQ
jgi:hypothetical protein